MRAAVTTCWTAPPRSSRYRRDGPGAAPFHALLRDIDRALDVAVEVPGTHGRDLLLQLVGIRRGLFADAPPYRRTPDPHDLASEPPAKAAA